MINLCNGILSDDHYCIDKCDDYACWKQSI